MKVLDVKENVYSFEFEQEGHDILLRDGLQKWIDKKIGKNKIKVMPPDLSLIADRDMKPLSKKEQKEEDEFCNELLTIAIVAALKEGLKEDKKNNSSILCNHDNEVPAKCKCDDDCYCKEHTCKDKKTIRNKTKIAFF